MSPLIVDVHNHTRFDHLRLAGRGRVLSTYLVRNRVAVPGIVNQPPCGNSSHLLVTTLSETSCLHFPLVPGCGDQVVVHFGQADAVVSDHGLNGTYSLPPPEWYPEEAQTDAEWAEQNRRINNLLMRGESGA